MANLDITIKRKVGATYDVLYPTTVVGQVVGLQTALDAKINTSARGEANGVATLDGNARVPLAQLPSAVFDSLYYFSAFGDNTTTAALADAGIQNAISINRNANGYYWVLAASGSRTITPNSTAVEFPVSSGRWHVAIIAPSDEGSAGSNDNPVTLENGDWIILNSVTGTGTQANPFVSVFAVVNNTYSLAGTSSAGIVRLSNRTSLNNLGSGGNGNSVITENGLQEITQTTNRYNYTALTNADKIAEAAHQHDSLYLGISATAAAATKWATERTITLAGDASGSVSIDGSTNVTLTVAVADDSHAHAFANITSKPTTLSGYGITDAVAANAAITAGTSTKITYDAKGLVTAGASLVAADIPNLDTAKITSGTFAIARIPTGTTSSTVALGDHTHTFASLTSKPTTLAGYGITDAASSTSLNNRPEIYYNAAADSDGDLVLDLDATTPDF
jgi:hypothetical protein